MKFLKKEAQISYIEKNYNGLKFQNDKQSREENPIERAVKTTIQILYDKGLFDTYNHSKAYEVLKHNLLMQDNNRRRLDSQKVINDVIL